MPNTKSTSTLNNNNNNNYSLEQIMHCLNAFTEIKICQSLRLQSIRYKIQNALLKML